MVHTYNHNVHYYETDKMGVTHHSNYIRFMEETRIDFMERIGYGYYRMEEEGVGSPVMAITCDYKKPSTYPDIVTVELQVLEMRPLKISFCYTMKVGETVVCTATSLHCFIDSDGRPVKYQERYPELAEKLREYLKA